jgi:hypothetical protein
MRVAGRAHLDGALVVKTDQVSLPAVGRRFVLLTAAGGVEGAFRSVVAPGLELAVSCGGTTCRARVLRRGAHQAKTTPVT